MDMEKTGSIIQQMRREKGWTQKDLADRLQVSDRTVSKWERGAGYPDVSLLPELSFLLGVHIEDILAGGLDAGDLTGGNMKKSNYFVCPSCGNISVCTGSASVACCGRKLDPLTAGKAAGEHMMICEKIDGELYVSSNHPMYKDHSISFVAFATGDQIQVFKQYPEWALQARIANRRHGMLLSFCTEHGLFYQNV
ncbi:helix-turn-helix domain-containing protein [Sporosarcina trichiuri]|uniref:helix-turn-helix domain-containing protein n=1 Tax=Sporosarcina trichiuri TaxID=3056445 RepID=UPI0025B35282|nr:helix-turn-helix domain-containing protein [Sporosarcina sp. 0.2-SM1T-5]WJY27560.1 helix-turn-helix domain-containing protein [Sporosarcina sp. 0.2-SM1T-5]